MLDRVVNAIQAVQILRRGLSRSRRFALFIAVFDNSIVRDQIIQLLQDSMPWTQTDIVHASPDNHDILDVTLSSINRKTSGPVMLLDMEHILVADSIDHPLLAQLNLARPDWPNKLPRPLVLWVTPYLLGLLGRRSPDFLDWRSDTISFERLTTNDIAIIHSAPPSLFGDYLFENERSYRVAELWARLSLAHPNSRVALTARAKWYTELAVHLNVLNDRAKSQIAVDEANRLHVKLKLFEPKVSPVFGVDGPLDDAKFIPEYSPFSALSGGQYAHAARLFSALSRQALRNLRFIRAKYLAEWARDIDQWLLHQGVIPHSMLILDYLTLGQILYEKGDIEESRSVFNEAIRVQKTFSSDSQ